VGEELRGSVGTHAKVSIIWDQIAQNEKEYRRMVLFNEDQQVARLISLKRGNEPSPKLAESFCSTQKRGG